MGNQYREIALRTWQERISKRLSTIAFCAFCVYMASISLGFVEWIPGIVGFGSLYGFLGLTVLAVLTKANVSIGRHAWWYLLFTALGFFSYFYAPDPSYTLSSLRECLVALIISVLTFNLLNNQKQVSIAMAVLTLAPTLLYLYLALTGQLETNGERLGQTLTGNANRFALVYMIGAICSVYFVFFHQKKWVKVVFLACFVAQIHALALSGGRKYFLLPVLLFCAMMIIRRDKKGKKQFLKNMLIVLGLIAVVVWAIFEIEALYETIGHRFEGFIRYLNGEGAEDYSSLARQVLKDYAIEHWLEAPLFGNGLDAFQTVSGAGVHCHNNYFELLCDLGIVGTGVYYIFPVVLLILLFRAKELGHLRWFWIAVVLCVLGFDYGAISYNKVLIHLMFVFATVMLKLSKKTEEKDAKGK